VKDPFPNAPRASGPPRAPGIRPDDPFPNLPARPSGPPKPSGIRPDYPFPNLPARPSGPPKPSGIRPDDPFPNLPARPSGPPEPPRIPGTSPLAPTKRTNAFGPPPTKHAVAKLPMRPGIAPPAESAPVIEPPRPAPPAPRSGPVISGRASEAPRLANVAASAGGVAAPPQRPPPMERPPEPAARGREPGLPPMMGEVPVSRGAADAARAADVPRPPVAGEPPAARPPAPINRTPPISGKSGASGGLDDLFGMGGADTRIRMPKAEESSPKKPTVATQEELAKQEIGRAHV
jgi:hypothetical protein